MTEKYLFPFVQKVLQVINKFISDIKKTKIDVRKHSGAVINTTGTKQDKKKQKWTHCLKTTLLFWGQ